MLVEILLKLVFGILNLILSVIPDLPAFDQSIIDGISNYLSLILMNGYDLLTLIIRPSTLNITIGVLIIIFSLEPAYHLVMYILKKIPFLNIK